MSLRYPRVRGILALPEERRSCERASRSRISPRLSRSARFANGETAIVIVAVVTGNRGLTFAQPRLFRPKVHAVPVEP